MALSLQVVVVWFTHAAFVALFVAASNNTTQHNTPYGETVSPMPCFANMAFDLSVFGI